MQNSIVEQNAPISQRAIYDQRYRGDGYERRSSIRVLRAEREALLSAARRAVIDSSDIEEFSVLDFGYGTGRVVNEFFLEDSLYATDGLFAHRTRVHVIAYDVSSQGLAKAASRLTEGGFLNAQLPYFIENAETGYIAGSMSRIFHGTQVTFTFVHGSEGDDYRTVENLLLEGNHDRQVDLTTSWYSALGHIFGAEKRRRATQMLVNLTGESGEIIISAAATGDLAEAQQHFSDLLRRGEVPAGYPIEVEGDVLYKTEIGTQNYWHVFDTDLLECLETAIDSAGTTWIEAIRMPDEEFTDAQQEAANYARAKDYTALLKGHRWTRADFRPCHTVGYFASKTPRLGQAS